MRQPLDHRSLQRHPAITPAITPGSQSCYVWLCPHAAACYAGNGGHDGPAISISNPRRGDGRRNKGEARGRGRIASIGLPCWLLPDLTLLGRRSFGPSYPLSRRSSLPYTNTVSKSSSVEPRLNLGSGLFHNTYNKL